MLKNDKGITVITLVITIIILMILVSISSYSGYSAIKSSRFYEGISEMKIMQAKVNELYEEYRNAENEDAKQAVIDRYGENVESSDRSSDAQIAFQTASSDNVNNNNLGLFEDYKFFSINYIKEDLDMEGIKYDFIINIKTRSVIMVDGVERDGKMFYSLCQVAGEQYNVDYEGE